MTKNLLFSETNYASKLIFSIFIVLASFVIFLLLAFLTAIPIFEINIFDASNGFKNFDNPQTISMLKYFQIIQSIGLFLVPPFIIAYLFGDKTFNYLKLTKKPSLLILLLGVIGILVAVPFIEFLAKLNSSLSFPDSMASVETYLRNSAIENKKLAESLFKGTSMLNLVVNIFMIAILPAIGEELLFRGVFQKIFVEWTRNVHVGVIIAAFLFSFFHFEIFQFIPRFMMGIFLGYLFVWSKSIWVPISVHFANNGVAVFYEFLKNNNMTSFNFEEITKSDNFAIYTILSILITSLICFFIYRSSKIVV